MLMTIKVTFPGQTDAAPVAVLARDALVWEKTVRPAQSFSSFLNDVTMTGVYYLAFIACRRQGLWTKDRASFEQECDAVPVPDDEEGSRKVFAKRFSDLGESRVYQRKLI